MFTFYSFYITWSSIISIGSIISLGLITNNMHDNPQPDICNVNIQKISFDIIKLIYFCLATRIIFGIIQIFTYCATHQEENSFCRKFVNLGMFIFYTISIVGLILISKQFTENKGCYNYYETNYNYVLYSYIGFDIIYMIETFAFVIAIISYICTCKQRESYDYQRF